MPAISAICGGASSTAGCGVARFNVAALGAGAARVVALGAGAARVAALGAGAMRARAEELSDSTKIFMMFS